MPLTTTEIPFHHYCAVRGDFGLPHCPETGRFWDISAARDLVRRTADEARSCNGWRSWRGVDPWHVVALCRRVDPLTEDNLKTYLAFGFLIAEWTDFISRLGHISQDDVGEAMAAANALIKEVEAYYRAYRCDGEIDHLKGYPVYAQ